MEYLNSLSNLYNTHPAAVILFMIWSLVWKGLALWRSAGLRQKNWFIAILIVNTMGILEMIYLYKTRKDTVEVIEG